jgi:hypothetical protein
MRMSITVPRTTGFVTLQRPDKQLELPAFLLDTAAFTWSAFCIMMGPIVTATYLPEHSGDTAHRVLCESKSSQ